MPRNDQDSRPDDGLSQRTARMFDFLKELQRLRTRVTRDLSTYSSVLWLAQLPEVPGVVSRHSDPDADVWLGVDRVEREAPPTPPAALRMWLSSAELRGSQADRPTLSARAVRTVDVVRDDGVKESVTEELLLEEHPELQDLFQKWLPEWQAWALGDRYTAAVGRAYEQLYRIYQDSRASAETYEVLLGFGFLTAHSGGQAVRRHLITMRVVVELDLDTGRLTVGPSPDGSSAAIEQDMLDPNDTVPDHVRESMLDGLAQLEDPWLADPDGVGGVLRTWVNGQSADASYQPQSKPQTGPTVGGGPVVSFAPALILRERARGSFIAACEQIAAQLRAGAPVPSGVRQFVDVTDGLVPAEDQITWAAQYADAEVYFPKPSNEDQRQIVQRLAESQTVVVQGPPGTGKTHTIANLVTDLLAHGQRVLITSNTTRALNVLKDQLPPEVRDLCVSVTNDPIKGQADLEHSVTTILSQADQWNERVASAEAGQLRALLAGARAEIQRSLGELRSILEQESYEYAPEIGDYQGTLQRIAQRLALEERELGWIGPVPTDDPSLGVDDPQTLLDLLRRATPELKSRAGRVPPLEALPTPGDFHELSERRGQLAAQGQRAEVLLTDERFAALPQSSAQDRQAALRAVQDVAQRRTELERRRESWIAPAVEDVLALRDRAWKAQLATTRQALSTAESLLQILGGHAVSGLNRIQPDVALGHVANLTQHLTSGKRLKGVFGIAKVAREAEPLLDRVRVDGQPADSIDRLSAVKARIELELALIPVEQLWRLPDGTDLPLTQRIARLQDEEGVLLQVLDFADVHGRAVALMRSMALDVDLGDPEAVNDTRIALDGLRLAGVRQDLEEALAPAVRVLRGVAAAPRAVPSVHRCLQTIADWDTKGYALAYAELANAADANALLGELTEADDRVRSATPALADRLHAASDDPAWDARLPLLHQAWAWSVWDRRVADKTDPAAEQHWRGVLKSAEREERRALQQLASNRGWAQCLSRLTPHESTHLNMYALAVRKAGKGTGKYVRRHQEDARSSLRQAQTAVPAWIMPMHQVFETVPVDRPNLFDVVIVDEASQSGLEAVLLSWLAPRLVIVGDDKQVSPSNVGMDHEDVYTLQDRYLAGLETKSLFGPMNSFFDQAVARSRSRIMLREHFRCMPEIIGFSNELSYRGELVPLRQYGIDRLPPLRSTFVRGALVSGRRDVVNEAEAQALVEQIAKCCADTAYDGRTMGVLTLLGNAQDKLIMSRLVETLGVREIEERRLRAGNAEAFQGDERHVMFVSMVSSMHSTVGPARIGALNKESDQQRLNVAASRAQDQLWLFHSVHPGDLSEKDLRRRFLQYVIKPTHEQDALDIGEVVADVPHGLFDSLFEQRVFLALRDRGYRVRPQLKVGRYRIDLVVEGGTRRLAVECDGDAYHGVEAHEDDAARQRDLERVGWTFWRVRGSTFYRDPASALEPLWRLLNDLGIEPAEAENIESELHQEVEAVLSAASGATDALAEPELLFEQPPAHRGQHVPDQVAPQPASQVEAEAADPVVPAAPSTARFRDGKMLLTRTARGRVEREREQVEAWLSCPPVPMGVDSRSLAVQRDKQNRHQEDLQDRVDYLQRVLDQSVATDDHRGGDWVTPGCMVGLLFEGEAEPELAVISSMDSSAETTVSPFTELGRVLDGVEVGSSLSYESARGRMTVSVIEILD